MRSDVDDYMSTVCNGDVIMAYGRALESSVLFEDHFSFPQSMPEKSILTTSTPFKL